MLSKVELQGNQDEDENEYQRFLADMVDILDDDNNDEALNYEKDLCALIQARNSGAWINYLVDLAVIFRLKYQTICLIKDRYTINKMPVPDDYEQFDRDESLFRLAMNRYFRCYDLFDQYFLDNADSPETVKNQAWTDLISHVQLKSTTTFTCSFQALLQLRALNFEPDEDTLLDDFSFEGESDSDDQSPFRNIKRLNSMFFSPYDETDWVDTDSIDQGLDSTRKNSF